MDRLFETGVQRDVPAAPLFVDDRPQFPIPGILRKGAPLEAEFCRETQSHRPLPFSRNADSRPDVVTDPFPTLAWLNAGKNIESGLKPGREAVCNFECFVESMIGREHAIDAVALAIDGVIAMKFDHRPARRNRFGGVHLNLVIILAKGRQREADEQQ